MSFARSSFSPKKILYIISFSFLGALIGLLLHAIVEIWYIGLLIRDFSTYSSGLTWNQWYTIHHVGTVVLEGVGIFAGYLQGKYWWRRIYITKVNS